MLKDLCTNMTHVYRKNKHGEHESVNKQMLYNMTSMTLGELLFHSNTIIKNNAQSILVQLKKQLDEK